MRMVAPTEGMPHESEPSGLSVPARASDPFMNAKALRSRQAVARRTAGLCSKRQPSVDVMPLAADRRSGCLV